MDDKRKAQRQRVLKGGKIIFANGSFTVDCTIRNLSDKGARLRGGPEGGGQGGVRHEISRMA